MQSKWRLLLLHYKVLYAQCILGFEEILKLLIFLSGTCQATSNSELIFQDYCGVLDKIPGL